MAVPPNQAPHVMVLSSPQSTEPRYTIELFFDYMCPYSAKLFKTLYHDVFIHIRCRPMYSKKVRFVLRPQVQPWHPTSILVHEAAMAVCLLTQDVDTFWKFAKALFEARPQFDDVACVKEGRNQTYRRLAKLAHDAVGVSADAVFDLLKIPEEVPATGGLLGNKVTGDVKRTIRFNRKLGIHVTPTVLLDGIEEPAIDSSFSPEQWEAWLAKNIV